MKGRREQKFSSPNGSIPKLLLKTLIKNNQLRNTDRNKSVTGTKAAEGCWNSLQMLGFWFNLPPLEKGKVIDSLCGNHLSQNSVMFPSK